MDKHAIRIEIGRILDEQCHECPYGGRSFSGDGHAKLGARKSSTVVPECRTCPYYEQLQSLGKSLITDEFKMSVKEFSAYKYQRLTLQEIASLKHVSKSAIDHWVRDHKEEIQMQMSVEEYHQLKTEHKTDTKIAIVKNVSQQTLYNWKKKHENELKSAKNDTKTTENVQKPNQLLSVKLSTRVKEQEKEISKLQGDLAATVRQVDALLEDKKSLMKKLETANHQNRDLLDQTIEDLNASLSKARLALHQLEEEKADLLESTQNQAGTIDNLQKSLGNAIENYKAQNKQIKDLNSASDGLKNEIEVLKKEKYQLNEAAERIRKLYGKEIAEHASHRYQLRTAEAFIVSLIETRS